MPRNNSKARREQRKRAAAGRRIEHRMAVERVMHEQNVSERVAESVVKQEKMFQRKVQPHAHSSAQALLREIFETPNAS